MEKPDDECQWIPAAEALHAISCYLASTIGLENEAANKKAVFLLFDRLASGDLFASPKGLMLPYASESTDIKRWYALWFTKATGEKVKYQIESGAGSSDLTIPVEFWHPFQRGADGAGSDWGAGDFYLDNVCEAGGKWSGRVRDVHFNRIDLPASWLSPSQPSRSEVKEQVPEGCRRTPSDFGKGTLPSCATNSDRVHEAAAHAAAKIVRVSRCSRAKAIGQVRGAVDAKGRHTDSIDRAIRKAYGLMYEAHGYPIKN